MSPRPSDSERAGLEKMTAGKSEYTLGLLNHFINEYKKIGNVNTRATKTMIAVTTSRKSIAYISQLGKNFIHVVFMFKQPYLDNLCFQKVAQVPGQPQFNHHLRIVRAEDINAEVRKFMKMAYQEGN